MIRSKALVVLTRQIRHVCPYKGQDVPLALCYRRSQDIADDYCYGCSHVETLKRKWGLRTFVRRLVVSRCKHCDDAASLHDVAEPHKSTRSPCCPGYEPFSDEGVLHVPTNRECTEWMVVDVATGVRRTLAEYKGEKRHKLPLVGAPGTVQSDSRDELRHQAAEAAARKRAGARGAKNVNDETTNEMQNTTVKVRSTRRKSR